MVQGKLEDARRLNGRVLTIRAAAFGEEDVSYAHSLNTLGTLMCKNVSLGINLHEVLPNLCVCQIEQNINYGGKQVVRKCQILAFFSEELNQQSIKLNPLVYGVSLLR